ETHTAASLRARACPSHPLPPSTSTWHRCQRHGSVPWHATCHLPGTTSGCSTVGWARANWGSSDHHGCPVFGCPEGGLSHLFNGNLKCTSSGLHMSARFTPSMLRTVT
ncbi:hypothetical protein JOQ06_008851, partial [Pogonophryne albipinna]